MISLPTAILIAGIVIGIGFPAAMIGAFYFAYKMLLTATIFKSATNANDAAFLHRQFSKETPKPPEADPVIPDMEISSMADSEEMMANLRRNQDPSPEY